MGYIAIIVLTFGIFAFLIVILDGKRVDRAIRKQYRILNEEIGEYQKRAALISEHVHDYYNSLATEGRGGLDELQSLQDNLGLALEQISRLIEAKKYRTAEDMMFFLQGEDEALSPEWQQRTGVDFPLLRGWQKKLEESIQTVGKDIAKASEGMKKLGVTRTRKRQPTLMSLEQAGVNLIEKLRNKK